MTLRILQQADELLDGWSCLCSTDCCHFEQREPSVTRAEWELIAKEIKRQGRKLPSLKGDECPFLVDKRCSVYAVRPLGCRTYFCRDGSGPGEFPRSEMREIVAKLNALVLRDDDKARPLRSWVKTPPMQI
jgi:uncharacterized protein